MRKFFQSECFVVQLALCVLILLVACDTELPANTQPILTQPVEQLPQNDDPPAGEDANLPISEDGQVLVPAEYTIYQTYLDVIDGKPRRAQTAVIEATIVQLALNEVCPMADEVCPVQPYPQHAGLIRLDNVMPADSDEIGQPIEGQDDGGSAGSDQSEPNQGQDIATDDRVPTQLAVGQETEVLFQLTTQPVRVRYLPTNFDRAEVTTTNNDMAEDPTDTSTSGVAGSGSSTSAPALVVEEGVLTFATQIGSVSTPTDKLLPGLTVGSRFRATVKYDGRIFVEEYELLP